jgi:L-alanine-DL-glutamate epimerase-like enolase superfamily enzyme
MKITKVEVLEFHCHTVPFFHPIGCRIYTDEGIYGDGEAALSYGVGYHAAFGMIRDLAQLVIGMDPLDNEVIWDKMHKETFWGMAGGPVVFAGISAIDMAVWDIRAKTFGVPLYKLLGGKRNTDCADMPVRSSRDSVLSMNCSGSRNSMPRSQKSVSTRTDTTL